MDLMPDSGATCSLADIECVIKWGIPMDPVDPRQFQVTSPTGQSIHIVGRASLMITNTTQDQHALHFLVAENTGLQEVIVG